MDKKPLHPTGLAISHRPPTNRTQRNFHSNLTPITSSHNNPTFASRMALKTHPIPIILYIKILRCVRRWRKRAKNSRHRLFVLNEWINTQRAYIQALELIIDKIEKPLRESKLLSDMDLMVVFPSVDVLLMLSRSMLADLEALKKNWKPAVIKITPTLMALEPYFKIYTEYCKKYYKGMEILKTIRGTPEFTAIQKSLPMDIDSYLIKPIQRPPKYMLLMRDYHKHMPPSHPDYKMLAVAIEKYHNINEINNEAIDRQGRTQKFFRLQRMYGQLMQGNRQYRREIEANTFDHVVKLYIFNDLILINKMIDQYREDSYKVMELDDYSFIDVVPDGKYYSNKLLLCGKYQAIHLFFINRNVLKKEYDFFKEMIIFAKKYIKQRKSLNQKRKAEVKVPVTLNQNKVQPVPYFPHFKITVRGAQKRPISLVKNQTIYTVRYKTIQPWRFYQNIPMHYSEIESLYLNIRKRFPDITLPQLYPPMQDVGIYDQTKNKSQIIEYRIMAIQQFLNRVFRCDKMMVNPVSILEVLKIDQTLFQFAVDRSADEVLGRCDCAGCGNRLWSFTLEGYMRERERFVRERGRLKREEYCMVRYATEQMQLMKLDRIGFGTLETILLYHQAFDGVIDFNRIYRANNSDTLQIKVYFVGISNQQPLEVKINHETMAGQIISMVGLELGMMNMQDFGLFLNYNGQPRILDPHQPVYETLKQVQAEVKQLDKSFFSMIKSSLNVFGEMVKLSKFKLYLRKYVFLTPEIELAACRMHKDQQRYRLLLQQNFFEVADNRYNLSDDEFAELTALYLCIKEFDKLSFIRANKFPKQTVLKLLPPDKHELATNFQWLDKVVKMVQIHKGATFNYAMKKQKIFDRIIKILQTKIGWGYFYFPLSSDNPSLIPGKHSDVYIGVSFKDLIVVPRKYPELLISIPLESLIYKISVFSIFIEYNSETFRFNGRMLYDVDKLVRKYLQLRRLFPELLDERYGKEVLSTRTTGFF